MRKSIDSWHLLTTKEKRLDQRGVSNTHRGYKRLRKRPGLPSSPYDVERYEAIRALSVKLLQELTDESYEKIVRVFASENGYQTPKVDVRAVLFRNTNAL